MPGQISRTKPGTQEPRNPETQPGPAPQYLPTGPYGPSTDKKYSRVAKLECVLIPLMIQCTRLICLSKSVSGLGIYQYYIDSFLILSFQRGTQTGMTMRMVQSTRTGTVIETGAEVQGEEEEGAGTKNLQR